MARHKSRLNITVKEHSVWDKLKSVNWTEYGLDQSVIEKNGTISIVDYNTFQWGIPERNLKKLVGEIAAAAPGECIIIADTHTENSDPYNYLVYYFNEDKDFSPWSIMTRQVGFGADSAYHVLRYALKQAYSAEELYEFAEEFEIEDRISDPSNIDCLLANLLDDPDFYEQMYEELNPDNNDGMGNMSFETEIADIKDWLSYADIPFGYKENYFSEYALQDGYAERSRKMRFGEISGDELIQHLMTSFD